MKRFLIGTVILALVALGAFAQNAAYKENLEKAKSFESQKKWVNALASYYDAMAAEPNEKAEEAYKAYTELADTIKAGMPGYGEMDEFAIYDGWMAIAGEWEKYWKENCPVYFKCGTIEKGELDMETRTGSYKASLTSSYTSKYKELKDVVLEGWKNAYRSEWKGCSRNSLKLNDNPEGRKYSVSASVVDAQGKILYSLFEKECDYYASDSSKDLYKWTVKNVSRDKMKEIDATTCTVKPNGVSWTISGKKTSYDMSNAEFVESNRNPASNAYSLVIASLPSRIEKVFVQGGTFRMGSYSGFDNEKPVHNVTVSSFYMGKTEVNQVQWKAVMGNNPSYYKGDNRPVESVSWYDAIVFCNKLSMMDKKTPVYSVNGKTDPDTWNYKPCNGNSINETISMNMNAGGYRLPTEAEWEYAARGGNRSKGYEYSGSDDLDRVAWRGGNILYGYTHDVATKAPNELGLYDMSGNVWEWCWDWCDSNYYGKSPSSNPSGITSGAYRVLRGGGCGDNALLRWAFVCNFDSSRGFRVGDDYRVAYRDGSHPCDGSEGYGFRVVCSAVDD